MELIDNNLNNLVSAEECLQVLSKTLGPASKVEVASFEVTKIEGDVAGFLGEHLKLVIETKCGRKIQYFVKSLPLFNLKKRKFLEKSGIFGKEVDLYGLLMDFEDLGGFQWRPKCYLNRPDLIILEDLGLLGYSTAPDRFNFEQSHVQLVLKSLAALHAASLSYEKRSGKVIGEAFKHCLFEVSALRDNTWFVTGLKCLVSVAAEATKYSSKLQTPEQRETFLQKLLEVCDHVQQAPPEFRRVFCHRDVWTKNFLFSPSPEDPQSCVLIDFQIARYLPPGADVMMATCMLQHREQRERDFASNLRFYYAKVTQMLAHAGIEAETELPLVQLEASCGYFQRLALVLKGIFLTMTHLPPGVMNAIHADEEEYHRFITIDRAPTILRIIETDECFRTWMVETVEELVELAFL